jgi:hypothetical protein
MCSRTLRTVTLSCSADRDPRPPPARPLGQRQGVLVHPERRGAPSHRAGIRGPTRKPLTNLSAARWKRGKLSAQGRSIPTLSSSPNFLFLNRCRARSSSECAAAGSAAENSNIAKGDLPPRTSNVVPGHQIVGVVEATGEGTSRFRIGDRIGVAWLRYTCGRCRFCARGLENLCTDARFTGWDVDGGYAEYAVVDERYACRLPSAFSDERAAPLLCAGIIGYRALRRARLPSGGRPGIYGFGASAHLTAQIAVHEGAIVHVATRSRRAQDLALELGAASVGEPLDPPPERLDAAILFAPRLVPIALEALAPGASCRSPESTSARSHSSITPDTSSMNVGQ